MKNTHTHAHPQIPHTTYTSHSYTHSHLMNTLSHRQRPKWDPRPEARPRPHSKCKTQTKSVFSWARGSVPGQRFGLNSSCYFPNNRSLCPNSPSTVSCPATWNLITSGISFPPHWPCPGAGEQAARTASKRFRSSSIDPRHLPPERLGLWGFNVCQGLQLPPIHMPGVTTLGKKSLDLLHQLFICSHRHHCSIHTTYRCMYPYVLIHPRDTHSSIHMHTVLKCIHTGTSSYARAHL